MCLLKHFSKCLPCGSELQFCVAWCGTGVGKTDPSRMESGLKKGDNNYDHILHIWTDQDNLIALGIATPCSYSGLLLLLLPLLVKKETICSLSLSLSLSLTHTHTHTRRPVKQLPCRGLRAHPQSARPHSSTATFTMH